MELQTIQGKPGQRLKDLRVRLQLTTRNVAELSRNVAVQQMNEEFSISHARLVQLESADSVPSIHKLFTLSAIYGVALNDLMDAYVNLEALSTLRSSMQHSRTHVREMEPGAREVAVPQPCDRPKRQAALIKTSPLSELIQVWSGEASPFQKYLGQRDCRYAFIGLSDSTMSPLIRPGSLVQFEECRKILPPSEYGNEYDRPIYFIETRAGYVCSWCEVRRGRLISIPHPLSPSCTREFLYPTEAEVVGRVIGAAVRLVRDAGDRDSNSPKVIIAAKVAGTC